MNKRNSYHSENSKSLGALCQEPGTKTITILMFLMTNSIIYVSSELDLTDRFSPLSFPIFLHAY